MAGQARPGERQQMENRDLLVLGASGHTGRRFVEMALARGHRITALVRSMATLPAKQGLRVIVGDVLDPITLQQAAQGMDGVVSCLGIRKQNPSDPWSALISPLDLTTRSAANMVAAMRQNGINRCVAISSAGIGDSWPMVHPELQKLIETSNVAKIFQDLNTMEDVLAQSGLDTLAIRPVAVVDAEETGRATHVDRFDLGAKITTGDIARWMLDAMERPVPFSHRYEMIGTNPLQG